MKAIRGDDMKNKYKYLIISIAIVMMISIPVSKVVLDGYFEYKQAINNMSIDKRLKRLGIMKIM